nr:cation-translocating P-type ATPase [Corynebacterium mendelii]
MNDISPSPDGCGCGCDDSCGDDTAPPTSCTNDSGTHGCGCASDTSGDSCGRDDTGADSDCGTASDCGQSCDDDCCSSQTAPAAAPIGFVDACGCVEEPETVTTEQNTPWYKDSSILVPLAAGVMLVAGHLAHPLFFFAALALGASQFVPGSLTRLVTGPKRLTIGLLMTISAAGAVALGEISSAAALAFLFSLAEALEHTAMRRARASLTALVSLIPDTVRLVVDKGRRSILSPASASTRQIPVADLAAGDVFAVFPGERIPTDGIVVWGNCAIDASAVTGESIPVAVDEGDSVPAGAIVQSSPVTVKATAPGSDNTLTTIVSLVTAAQRDKGERARMADTVAAPLIPTVLAVSAAVAAIGSLLGDPHVWINRALVVLVAASPCALAIAVPVTVIAAIGAASKIGVVVTSGAAFERLGAINRIAFDKTGTLTTGTPKVVAVEGDGRTLELAAALERTSTHPLAVAITQAAEDQGLSLPTVSHLDEHPGKGVSGVVERQSVTVANPRALNPGRFADRVTHHENQGRSVAVVAWGAKIIGIIAVADPVRDDAAESITHMMSMGIEPVMLTGDNQATATAVGTRLGIDAANIHAQLAPGDKADYVGGDHTAMIGDGINDAPALARADVGIAMGPKATDAAVESADVALRSDNLATLVTAVRHARRGRRIITANIILALAVICVLPPLALFGVLGLGWVVLIHETAEVIIIANGLRAARVTGWTPPAAPPIRGEKLTHHSNSE